MSGKGELTVTRASGEKEIHPVDEKTKKRFSIDVGIGDKMQ